MLNYIFTVTMSYCLCVTFSVLTILGTFLLGNVFGSNILMSFILINTNQVHLYGIQALYNIINIKTKMVISM